MLLSEFSELLSNPLTTTDMLIDTSSLVHITRLKWGVHGGDQLSGWFVEVEARRARLVLGWVNLRRAQCGFKFVESMERYNISDILIHV